MITYHTAAREILRYQAFSRFRFIFLLDSFDLYFIIYVYVRNTINNDDIHGLHWQ